jgi:cytochrome c biogenesis protein CcdA
MLCIIVIWELPESQLPITFIRDWSETRKERQSSDRHIPWASYQQSICFLVGFAFVTSLTEALIYWQSSVGT